MKRLLSRLSGFAANAATTGLATLLSISLIINLHGPADWSVFAVAQSAGLAGAVLVGFGWAVIGPATVAPLSAAERRREYSIAVRTRIAIFVAVACVATVVILSTARELAIYLPVAIAYASTGLSSLWYYVGTGQAWPSFFRDALPRAAASVVAPLAALMGATQPILGGVILTGSFVALISSWRFVNAEAQGEMLKVDKASFFASLSKQWHGLLSGGVSAIYMTLPTVFVGIMAPSAAGVFALGDKFVRLTSTALLPLTQVLQGWVPRATVDGRRSRAVRASRISALTGVCVGAALALAAPTVALFFTQGKVPIGFELSIPMGLVLACTLTTQVLGAGCLGAYGDFRAIAISAVVGAAVGLPVLLFATAAFGAPGAMSAVVAAESGVLLTQAVALIHHLRR